MTILSVSQIKAVMWAYLSVQAIKFRFFYHLNVLRTALKFSVFCVFLSSVSQETGWIIPIFPKPGLVLIRGVLHLQGTRILYEPAAFTDVFGIKEVSNGRFGLGKKGRLPLIDQRPRMFFRLFFAGDRGELRFKVVRPNSIRLFPLTVKGVFAL